MANAFKILACLFLFVLLAHGFEPLKRNDLLPESKIQSVSDRPVGTAEASRKKRDLPITLTVISRASSFLTSGSSFARGVDTLLDTGEPVNIAIELDNYSKWTLGSARAYAENGRVRTAPRTVYPGSREVMVASKTPWSFHGTWGSVSWLVGNNSGKRVIVMWHIPYHFAIWDTNRLAVGIIDDADVGPHWTSTMDSDTGGSFRRGVYSSHSRKIEFCDATMCVAGSMGSVAHTHAQITFYPKDANHLAPNIRNRM